MIQTNSKLTLTARSNSPERCPREFEGNSLAELLEEHDGDWWRWTDQTLCPRHTFYGAEMMAIHASAPATLPPQLLSAVAKTQPTFRKRTTQARPDGCSSQRRTAENPLVPAGPSGRWYRL